MEIKNYFIEVPSVPDSLTAVEEFIIQITEDLNIDEDKLYGILLSVSEATTNAIVHANKKDPAKVVLVSVTVENNILTVKVKDQGPGFNPVAVPDPTKPENLLKDSGRGLFLMRIYAKSLTYIPSPQGTETILVFEV
ncbi:MAG: ATP-binding protein [Ignavibacteriales bacterium]|nr:Anti-sigma F factor [Ignavibacteriaceae bacterium]MBW7871936.1 ATP-binding protein [Ignavibacteria bacterium]MBZ0197449.1 ATP-binding protein [Ignavibacteriaceae bacterium]MCZ2144213.1 ATP-binding protein [Ignavibacteriales bacterium]WKZ72970.1 MAG: ATP-binding protein [Ignavibacteriaceae bacterium]